jgi:hypothetical protein
MDLVLGLRIAGVGIALGGSGLIIRAFMEISRRIDAPVTGITPQFVAPPEFPDELQHYWVPNGERPGIDQKWWVFLGPTQTIWGFTNRDDAVHQADQLNRRERRGRYHPSRHPELGASARAAFDCEAPNGCDCDKDGVTRAGCLWAYPAKFTIIGDSRGPIAPKTSAAQYIESEPSAYYEVRGVVDADGRSVYEVVATSFHTGRVIVERTYQRLHAAKARARKLNDAADRIAPAPLTQRSRWG